MLKWIWMLNKRLYKKITFLVLLALIPACVAAFSLVAQQDSGFVSIALAQTETGDELSEKVIRELMTEDSVIRFVEVDGPAAALEAVKTGQADEAWIFPADMEGELGSFVAGDAKNVVHIITREQSVALRLSREKLSGVLYKYCAKAHYVDYLRTNFPDLDTLSDQELSAYFDQVSVNEDLFVFGNPVESLGDEGNSNTNYLTAPIRGTLGILAVLCGMAATLYYMRDEELGTFAWVRENRRIFVGFGCIVIAVVNVAAYLLISLWAAGLGADLLKEVLCLLLFSVCSATFCMALKQIVGSIRVYGALIPLLTVIMFAICPVFFDFRGLMALQLLFPPTYYVNALYDNTYLLYMIVYCLAWGIISLALERVRIRKIH